MDLLFQKIKTLAYLFLLLTVGDSVAQLAPPLRYYNVQEYKASGQNWKITHNHQGTVFFANNDGILVAESNHWQLLPSVNESIVRSVLFDKDRLYVGMYMEFGFYQQDNRGKFSYTSLSEKIKSALIEDEQFWNIFRLGNEIIFQSLDQLIIYHPEKENFRHVASSHRIIQGYVSNQRLFIQNNKKDILELKNGIWNPIALGDELNQAQISFLQTKENGNIELLDEWGNLFIGKTGAWSMVKRLGLNEAHIYSTTLLSNQEVVVGTISDGIRVYDQSWNLLYAVGSSNGIRNNTVLSIHQDETGNIWVGLDNGVMCINHTAPLSGYVDQQNEIGTIYAAALHNGKEYLGTNIGLFTRQAGSDQRYELIRGTSGQVWSLQTIGESLFVGHHNGSFQIQNETLIHTGSSTGTWKFISLPEEGAILAGTYQGIEILKKRGGDWKLDHSITGFPLSARHLEMVSTRQWLVSHEYKGVFLLEPDSTFSKINSVKKIEQLEKGIHSALAKFDGQVWFYSKKGLFRFNPAKQNFIRQDWADAALDSTGYYSGKMIPIQPESLTFFRENEVLFMQKQVTDTTYSFATLPVSIAQLKPMRGFENISPWSEQNFLMGGLNQYLVMDQQPQFNKQIEPLIYSCLAQSAKNPDFQVNLQDGTIPSDYRLVKIRFGTPIHQAYQEIQYQYRLVGLSEEWSPWTKAEEANFGNLPPGQYYFQLKTALPGQAEPSITEFQFRIARPFFQSPMMIVVYLLGIITLVYLIHRSYTGYYQKQQFKLIEENEKNLKLNQLTLEQAYVKEKNDFLENQFGKKKKELAQTLIHLNKNIELLSEVRSFLGKLPGDGKNAMLNKIDANLSDEDSWTLLETAFNQIDQQFLSKLKAMGGDLSPSDLKLCVYLRLNLSSKEIASLLNISGKSVEIKRYRLRKKLGLEGNSSLQQFILGI
ncbi:MAG: hypothetical protein FJZ78_08980 [Bacteroidetes bacterium]|nr:hypothetical protein [Bacteroidota bacterium]